MKQLYLLRHAKTEPDSRAGDHERVLTERGRADAALIGREIARRGYRPELILSSTSRRTVQTLDILTPFLAPAPPAHLEPSLYLAAARTILQRAGAITEDAASALFIGHNPGMEDLAIALAGDSDLGVRAAEKFPTACFAAFESDTKTWRDAANGRWRALAIIRPSDLKA